MNSFEEWNYSPELSVITLIQRCMDSFLNNRRFMEQFTPFSSTWEISNCSSFCNSNSTYFSAIFFVLFSHGALPEKYICIPQVSSMRISYPPQLCLRRLSLVNQYPTLVLQRDKNPKTAVCRWVTLVWLV